MNKSDLTNTTGISIDKNESSDLQAVWLLKTGVAMKLGKQAAGGISYEVLTDRERTELMIRITGNDGGGYVSKDVLSFDRIVACLREYEPNQPFPTKLLQTAFTGRSSNNASFLAAVLSAQGLLARAPDTEGRHIVSGNWADWKASMLSEPGQAISNEPSLAQDPTPGYFTAEPDQAGKKKVPAATRRKK